MFLMGLHTGHLINNRAQRIIASLFAFGCAACLAIPSAHAQQQNSSSRTAPQPVWLFRMHAWPGGASQLDDPTDDAQQAAGVDVQTMMDNMQNSAQRLQGGDPGAQTQQCQQKIVESLDGLIQLMAQMSSSGSCNNPKPSSSMKLQMNQTGKQPMSPSQAATNSYIPSGGVVSPGTAQPIDSQRQQWGNLPPSARNLILNAEHNETLPDYQQQVDSYYRALGQLNAQQQN